MYNYKQDLVNMWLAQQPKEVKDVLTSSGWLTQKVWTQSWWLSKDELDFKQKALSSWIDEADFWDLLKDYRKQKNYLREIPTNNQKEHWNFISRFWDSIKMESKEDDNILESVWKFWVNIFWDWIELLWDVWDLLLHPIDTAKSIYDFWYWVSDALLNKVWLDLPWEDRAKMARLLWDQIKENFTDFDKFKKMIVENPVDTILTFVPWVDAAAAAAKWLKMTKVAKSLEIISESMMKPIKMEFWLLKKWVEAPFKAVKPIAEYWISQATWLNVDTIRNIVKNPKIFQDVKTWVITRDSLVDDLYKWINKLESEKMRQLAEYKSTRDFPASVKFWNFLEDFLTKKWLEFENWKLIDPKNKYTSAELNKIEKFVEETRNALNRNGGEYMDIETFLNTRQKANKELAKFETWMDSDKLKALWKDIYREMNKSFRKQIPWLEKLDKEFSSHIDFYNRIKKDYFTKDWKPKDNIMSLLENITWKWKELKLERLKEIIPNIEEKSNLLKAYDDVQAAIWNKVWTYTRAWVWIWAIAMWNPVLAMIEMIIFNPKIAANLLQGAWYSKEFITNLLAKIKSWKKLNKEDVIALEDVAKENIKDDVLKWTEFTKEEIIDFWKELDESIKQASKEELLDMKQAIKDYWLPESVENSFMQKIDKEIENFNNYEKWINTDIDSYSLADHYWDDLTKAFNQLDWIRKRTKTTKGWDKMTTIEFENSPAYKKFSDKAQEYINERWLDMTVQELFEQMDDFKSWVKFQKKWLEQFSDEQIQKYLDETYKDYPDRKPDLEKYKNEIFTNIHPDLQKQIIKHVKESNQKKDLLALHNLSEDKLQKIKELWWMPWPSLAITKEWIPFEDFWDITLVWNKKLITSEKAWTYWADIYSPRVPKPEFILKDEQGLQKIADEIWMDFDLLLDIVERWDLEASFIKRQHPKIEKYIWDIKEKFDKKLFNWFTDMWRKRYKEYNLDNVVKTMFKWWTQGTESWIFEWSLKQMMWKEAKKKTFNQIKKTKFWNTEKDYELMWQKWEEKLDKLSKENPDKSFFDITSNINYEFSLKKSPESIAEELNKYWIKTSVEDIKEMQDIIKKTLNLPKTYLETKIKRWVNLDEFSYVLVPKWKENKVRELLKWTWLENKIEVYEWDRMQKIKEIWDKYWEVKFQKTRKGWEISQEEAKKIVEKYFKPDEIWVEFVDNISTPDWLEAFWKYKDKMITFAKNPIDSTPEHEVLHAYFDTVVKPNKKKEILDQIKKEKWFKNDLDAEEFLADNFVKYIQSREVKWISEKVKQFIKDLAIWFKEIFFENPDKVNELYRDLERLAKWDKRNLWKVALVGATQNKINQEDLEK